MPHPIEVLKPRSLTSLYHTIGALVSGRLWLKVLVGMGLGAFVGYLLNPETMLVSANLSEIIGSWVALPGRVFLTVVQMIIVPLVFAAVIRGIASNNSIRQLKSTGLKLVFYFLLTTALAAVLGIFLALTIRPGLYVDIGSVGGGAPLAQSIEKEIAGPTGEGMSLQTIPQAIVGILPSNPISDAVEANMLQIVIFSIIVGLALIAMRPEQSKPLLDLMGSLLEVSMTIVRWIMILAPYAVFGLIAQLVIDTGLATFIGIGVFVGTVLLGLSILLIGNLAIAYLFSEWRPLDYLSRIREAMLLAFSTDSSAATMPLSLKTVEEKLHVRPSIAQFVIPLGATVNMNATALFQGLTVIFFVQIYGLDISLGVIAALILTVVGASIGTPATPGAGIIILSVVLRSVGIPIEGIALIIGVDQILSRCRAMLNVTGDLTASVVMERLSTDSTSYAEEMHEAAALEKKREASGEDVILHPAPRAT